MDTISDLRSTKERLFKLLQASGFNARYVHSWITINEGNLTIEIYLEAGEMRFERLIIRYHVSKYPFRLNHYDLASRTPNWVAIYDRSFREFSEVIYVKIKQDIRDVLKKLFQYY